MTTTRNEVPGGFMARHRARQRDAFEYVALSRGYLRLEYGALLERVSFVRDPSQYSPAFGPALELSLDEEHPTATLIDQDAVSGVQWSNGVAAWGHTYDDESPPSDGKQISLEDWVDECVAMIINPDDLLAITEPFELASQLARIESGDGDARDEFWKKCSPRTEAEVDTVLALVDKAIEADADLLFTLIDPLKRASVEKPRILERLTTLIENAANAEEDVDTSELHEILQAHADAASPELAARWTTLCAARFDAEEEEALAVTACGHLFLALCRCGELSAGTRALFERVVAHVEASDSAQNDVGNTFAYQAVKHAVDESP